MNALIDSDLIAHHNAARTPSLQRDYEALGEQLDRRGVSIDAIKAKVAAFGVAIPSWGVGTGGTRFARFPGPGEPRDIFDKLQDCAVIQSLTRATPTVSLHIPWDKADPHRLKETAERFGLGFDAMNSNTFQDHPGDSYSYKFGSLSHTDAATRRQAVDHNIECIEIGKALGSKALTVWIGDGSNFPGQSNFTRAFERYLASMREVYKALPEDWRVFTEHKMYEPAFYSTVVQDWGTNYLIAQELGPKAFCLVDLGHHAPNVNIEMIVARLIQFGKLGGDLENGKDLYKPEAGWISRKQTYGARGKREGAGARGQLPLGPSSPFIPDTAFSVLEVDEMVERYESSAAPIYPKDLLATGTPEGVRAPVIRLSSASPERTSVISGRMRASAISRTISRR
jgi:L-rhamnose catabolism isomerase